MRAAIRFAVAIAALSGAAVVAQSGTPQCEVADAVAAPDDPPALFTALQEQLGLKLESATTQMRVLVVDHIERPDPD